MTTSVHLEIAFYFIYFFAAMQEMCSVYHNVREVSSNTGVPKNLPQTLRQKILLVWQADFRNEELERAQELVIK